MYEVKARLRKNHAGEIAGTALSHIRNYGFRYLDAVFRTSSIRSGFISTSLQPTARHFSRSSSHRVAGLGNNGQALVFLPDLAGCFEPIDFGQLDIH